MTTTLDEIRSAAANGKGVDLIPFKDTRAKATSIADEVNRCKTAAARWNYETYAKQKDNLLKQIQAGEKAIEAKKKEIDDFKRQHKESSTAPLEADQRKLEGQLKDSNDALRKMNDELGDAAEDFKRLWNARGGLREIFKDALDDVKSGMINPEKYLGTNPTDADKEMIKKSLYVIEGMIEEQEKEHRVQEEGAKATEQKFRDLIRAN